MSRIYLSCKCLLIFITSLFLLAGCFKEDLEDITLIDWHPEVALPLLNAEFKVQDIISNFESGGFLQTNEDGIISIFYKGEILTIKGFDLYKFSDILFTFTGHSLDILLPYEDGEIIKKFKLSSGSLHYEIVNAENEDIQVILKIPNALKNGMPFQERIFISSQHDLSKKEGILNLDGYTFDLKQPNQIEIIYEATNLKNKQQIILKNFEGKITDLLFEYIEGNFGSKSLGEYLDTVKLDVFNNWVGGSIFLEEPKIKLDIENSFGFPLTANFTNFSSENEENIRILEGEVLVNGIDCNFPGVPKAGGKESSEYIINSNNSNLQNFLSISPKKITYGLSVNGKSNIDYSNFNFFVSDSSYLKLNLDLEIPLHGRIENVVLLDTFSFHLKNKKKLDNANFKLLVENTFPNDAEIQIFFTSAEYENIDSLFTPLKNIFSSGLVGENGKVISSSIEETNIYISSERYRQLLTAEKILVRVKLVSFNKDIQSVKYTMDNGLSIKMGVVAGLKP